MNENDNGHGAAPPVVPPPQLKSKDIQSQVGMVRTIKGETLFVFPQTPDGTPDLSLTLELMATGLNILAQIMRQQAPQDAKRIVVVPGVPPGVNLRGRADKL